MIKTFRHKGLERFYSVGSKAGVNPLHAKRLGLILSALDSAVSPEELRLPGLNLHALSGKLNGFWAVTVNGNWRIIFTFSGQDADQIDYLDYR